MPPLSLLDRRTFLLACCGLGTACAGFPRRPVESLPLGPVVLGWRWVPGMELTYRTTIEQVSPRQRTARYEEWTYLVRALDSRSIATVEGRLTGLGASQIRDGEPVPDAALTSARLAEAERVPPVTLRVGMDGRLRFISETQFADALCHSMLALRLPVRAVAAYDEWKDLDFVDLFAQLIPADLDVKVEGRSRLMELHERENQALAIIESHGVVRTAEGPEVTVSGVSSWDAGQGLLARREQSARFSPTEPNHNPGVLSLTMIRI